MQKWWHRIACVAALPSLHEKVPIATLLFISGHGYPTSHCSRHPARPVKIFWCKTFRPPCIQRDLRPSNRVRNVCHILTDWRSYMLRSRICAVGCRRVSHSRCDSKRAVFQARPSETRSSLACIGQQARRRIGRRVPSALVGEGETVEVSCLVLIRLLLVNRVKHVTSSSLEFGSSF